MTEVQLKNRLGVFLVGSHFFALLLVILFWLLGAFLTDEMTTSIAIIAPFFAAYTTAIIRYVIKNKNKIKAQGRELTPIFVFFSFLTPGIFVAVVILSIFLKGFNIGISSFENFKLMLATSETIFGVYVGQLIFSLFESVDGEAETDGKG